MCARVRGHQVVRLRRRRLGEVLVRERLHSNYATPHSNYAMFRSNYAMFHLLGGDPLLGVEGEHAAHQVKPRVGERRLERCEWRGVQGFVNANGGVRMEGCERVCECEWRGVNGGV